MDLLRVLFILISLNAYAQEVRFEVPYQELTEKYNLNSKEVYKVEKDSKGNVWICSDGGVNMFDGTQFHSFTTDDGLVDNVVFDVYEDYQGRIWFLAKNSELCYYQEGGITVYPYNKQIVETYIGLTQNQKKLVIDTDDNLFYAVHHGGLIKISPEGEFTQLQHEIQEVQIQVLENEAIMSNRATFNSIDGVQINESTNTWFIGDTLKSKISTSIFANRFCIVKCKNDEIYYSVENDIISVSKKKSILKIESLIEFGEFDDNHFWVGMSDGLLIVSKESGEVRRRIFDGLSISSVLRINKNSFWIGTLNQGVLFVKDVDLMFLTKENGLIKNDIVDICGTADELFVSFGDCIQNLSRNTSFQFEKDDRVFFGATDSTLIIGSDDKESIEIFDRSLVADRFIDSYGTKNVVFWTLGGSIYSYNEETKSRYCWYNRSADSLENTFFTSIYYNKDIGLIAGDDLGLYQIKDGKPIKLNESKITDITNGYDESILISTADQGVRFMHKSFTESLTIDNGLLSNKVLCLESYNDSLFFFGTNKGVNWYNVNNHELGQIKLPNETKCTSLEFFHDSIFIGTKSGMYKLSVHDLEEEDYNGEFLVSIKTVNIDSLDIPVNSDKLIIPFGTKVMKINMSCLDFEAFRDFKMQFRLNNEDQWTDINDLNVLILTPQDNFRFEVRYLKGNGKWSVSKKLFSVEVELPFYQRIEFFILSFIVFITVLYFTRRFFLRKKRRKVEAKQKLFQLEQQIQQTKMNPHFLFNILNSIHSQIVFEEYESAEAYLMKFSKFLRRLVSRTTVDSISIGEEIEFLEKYVELQKVGVETEFNFEIKIDQSLNSTSIPAMMLQPLIENAIYYGVGSIKGALKGRISLTIEEVNDSTLKVVLTDNGQGDLKKKTEEGHAIDITRKRLSFYNELNNCSYYSFNISRVQAEKPMTRVELLIPIIK